ncbi:MAG: cob(I)yrinic acid a,c-diamide adenosyltransferase [Anaerolineales bacterium]|nr:cob(I)yrinic acid a,c-diamide adenosyltransferase [Anaerolineales bacterium]MCB8986266.1 cob(I)yrinic acid a,c-diamide adenosyltransferase [Ardenticatenaceae bacterium]
MPRLTKIYTRKGDAGQTSLAGGQQVPKESLRIEAYGTVDELNSQIGAALAGGLSDRLGDELTAIQNELFHLGSDLAFLEEDKAKYGVPQIEERHIQKLERLIDELTAVVGPLENFILPGGSAAAASLHVARTVCRRAERHVIALSRQEAVGAMVIPYLNRLSDALFVMARYENYNRGVEEPLWDSRA